MIAKDCCSVEPLIRSNNSHYKSQKANTNPRLNVLLYFSKANYYTAARLGLARAT